MSETIWVMTGAIGGWFLKVLKDYISARTVYDHRFRIEKEYQRYCDLWEKLFELRRAIGQLVGSIESTANVRHDEKVLEWFNAYQLEVRKGEPFMIPVVYQPSIQIVNLARKIIGNVGKSRSLENSQMNEEQLTDEQVRLDHENVANFDEIDQLFQKVLRAIRHRVMP